MEKPKKKIPNLQPLFERRSKVISTQTEPLSFIHESTQTHRPRHRSVQVQATDTRTKQTQTGKHSVQRPDRFDADKIRREKQISEFETLYMSKSQISCA